jgi:hypothetical protein
MWMWMMMSVCLIVWLQWIALWWLNQMQLSIAAAAAAQHWLYCLWQQ